MLHKCTRSIESYNSSIWQVPGSIQSVILKQALDRSFWENRKLQASSMPAASRCITGVGLRLLLGCEDGHMHAAKVFRKNRKVDAVKRS